jgi:hypothetical protein
MRFALVHELEIDAGKRRCAPRPSLQMHVRRGIEAEPDDAVKSRVVRSRNGASEPGNAAKGERGASGRGGIQC